MGGFGLPFFTVGGLAFAVATAMIFVIPKIDNDEEVKGEEREGDGVPHWRNSQLLHIQYTARKAASRWNAPFCFHFSCGAGARKFGGNEELRKNLSKEVYDELTKSIWKAKRFQYM